MKLPKQAEKLKKILPKERVLSPNVPQSYPPIAVFPRLKERLKHEKAIKNESLLQNLQ